MLLEPRTAHARAALGLGVGVCICLTIALVLQALALPWAMAKGPRHVHAEAAHARTEPSWWEASMRGPLARHAARSVSAGPLSEVRMHPAPLAPHHHVDEQRHHHVVGDPTARISDGQGDRAQEAVLAFAGSLSPLPAGGGLGAGLGVGMRHVLRTGAPTAWTEGPSVVLRRPPKRISLR